jgi:hypothetical protein
VRGRVDKVPETAWLLAQTEVHAFQNPSAPSTGPWTTGPPGEIASALFRRTHIRHLQASNETRSLCAELVPNRSTPSVSGSMVSTARRSPAEIASAIHPPPTKPRRPQTWLYVHHPVREFVSGLLRSSVERVLGPPLSATVVPAAAIKRPLHRHRIAFGIQHHSTRWAFARARGLES